MAVTKSVFGKSQEGKEISLYTLSNSKGMQAKVTDLGANLVGILVPDAQGVTADVTPVSYTHLDVYKRQGLLCGHHAHGSSNRAFSLRTGGGANHG